MSKKGIRVKYAEFMALLKVTVNMDEISLEKSEMQIVLLDF